MPSLFLLPLPFIPQSASSTFRQRLCACGGAANSTSPQLQLYHSQTVMNSVLLPLCFILPRFLRNSPLPLESPRAKYPRKIDDSCFAFAAPPLSFSLLLSQFKKFVFCVCSIWFYRISQRQLLSTINKYADIYYFDENKK